MTSILQSFVSQFNSLRVKLSVEAYQHNGLQIFHSEKIPFADRTGPFFAQKLVAILVTRLTQLSNHKRYHLYELGTGNGILAKRILDILKRDHQKIYQKIILHATDFSSTIISELQSALYFKQHRDHLVFEVLDATKPNFAHRPIFVYCTNLIDSLPSRHIQVIDGQPFEVLTQTSLAANAQVIDTTIFPPRLLSWEQIVDVCKSSDSSKRLSLAPQLLGVLAEQTKLIPVAEIALNDFIRTNQIAQGDFNYSLPALSAIKKILTQLKTGGCVLISDFGVDSVATPSLRLEFGVVVAFGVCVPLIKHVVQGVGARCLVGPHKLGGQLEILIDTFTKDKSLDRIILDSSVTNVQTEVELFLTKARTMVSGEGVAPALTKQKNHSAKLVELYDSLTPAAQVDYRLLNDFSQILVRHAMYDLVFRFTDLLLTTYEYTAGIYYHLFRGQAYQQTGRFVQAERCFKQACRYQSALPLAYLGNLYSQQHKINSYIKTVKKYISFSRKPDLLNSLYLISLVYDQNSNFTLSQKILNSLIAIGTQLNNLPPSEQEILRQSIHKASLFDHRPHFWGEKTITFFCGRQFTAWDPYHLSDPQASFVGGADEAVMYLTTELANLGWKVTVYGEPITEGKHGNVEWLNYRRFDSHELFNILIFWRHPALIDQRFRSQKTYLWSHDMVATTEFTPDRLSKLDKIIFLSNFHRSTLAQISDEKCWISRNGFAEHFPATKPANNPQWCIWSSNYDRGLEHILSMWPEIRQTVPQAKLHIFYGWQLFDNLYQHNPQASLWKKNLEAMMQQPGVIHHGRVSQVDIEKWYKQCGIFAYPTHFREISCISAIKAQAFGAVPVTTDLGALTETVQFGTKIPGDIRDAKVKKKYARALITALQNDDWQKQNRQKMMVWAREKYEWAQVAREWSDQLQQSRPGKSYYG